MSTHMTKLPADLTNHRITLDPEPIIAAHRALFGQEAGRRAAYETLDMGRATGGWRVVYDLRHDTPALAEVVCEARRSDGSMSSAAFRVADIRAARAA